MKIEHIIENGIAYSIQINEYGTFYYDIQTLVLHRERDLPAVTHIDGTQQWFIQGNKHRLTGPAQISQNQLFWCFRGRGITTQSQDVFEERLKEYVSYETHNSINYRIEKINRQEVWYLQGTEIIHREHGPAWIFEGGTSYWYYRNKLIEVNSQQEFQQWLNLKIFT